MTPSPTKVALWQFAQNAIIGALCVAFFTVYPLLSASGAIDWSNALRTFFLAFAMSVFNALATYYQVKVPGQIEQAIPPQAPSEDNFLK